MAIRSGRRRCATIGRLASLALALLIACAPARAAAVRAQDHDAFWLWAGVAPQDVLARARAVYLLAGEVTGGRHPHLISQRSATPHVTRADVWIVFRVQSLAWEAAVTDDVMAQVARWQAAGNRLVGVQIDFDAGTRHLEGYAAFLSGLRQRLPPQLRLGVTGLLDWSAHADPAGLDALAGVVDEVVLQIYQGRHVIPGYQAYLARLQRLKVPFRIGLLQGGDWQAPYGLEQMAQFRGYVVFLVNGRAK